MINLGKGSQFFFILFARAKAFYFSGKRVMKSMKMMILAAVALLMFSGCVGGPTPLIKASFEGKTDEVKSLLDKGADIDEKGTLPNATRYAPKYWLKSTPLMAAAHYGQDATVDLLLSRGADINAENFLCLSAVHLATVSQKKEMVERLVKKGAKVNPQDPSSGWCFIFSTPLQLAAYNGDAEIVKLLVRSGADIDATGYCGYSALLFAAQEGHYDAAEYLLKNGADPKLQSANKIGCRATTPLKIAEEKNHSKIAKLIKDAQAGLVPIQKTVAAPPEDPSEASAFVAEAEKYRESAVKPVFPEEARKYKAQAEFAFQQKRFEDAAEFYEEALKSAPWWPDGHFNRALILGELSRYEEAVREMKRYLLLAPDAPDARDAQDRIYQWESVSE
jgi:ankyrin repeat protein